MHPEASVFARTVVLVTLALAGVPAGLPAQGLTRLLAPRADSAKPVAPPADTAARALDPVEISAALEHDAVRIREMLALFGPSRAVERIRQEMPALLDSLRTRARAQDSVSARQRTRRSLLNARDEWSSVAARLDLYGQALAARGAALDSAARSAEQLVEVWTLTRDSVRVGDYPEELRRRVGEMVAFSGSLRAAIRQHRSELLGVRNQLSEAKLLVAERLDRADAALEEYRRGLLRLDSPPLWRALGQEGALPAREAMRVSLREASRATIAFAQREGAALVRVGLMLLLLVGVVAWAGRRLHRRDDPDPRLVVVRAVLRRPLAAGTLVALVTGVFLLPGAPASLVEAALLLTLGPVLVLVPPLLPPPARGLAIALPLLWGAQTLLRQLLQVSLAWRLSELAESALLALVLLRFLRPGGPAAALPATHAWRALPWFLRSAVLLAVVALGSNVVGNASLASTLNSGVLVGAYTGLLFYACDLVADGLVALALRNPVVRSVRAIASRAAALEALVERLTDVVFTVSWVAFTLFAFDLLEPAIHALLGVLRTPIGIGTVAFSIGDVLAFVLALVLAVWVGRAAAALTEEDILGRRALPRGVPTAIATLVKYGVVAVGFFVALGAAGVDVTKLAIVAGALSVGIGFGLQNIVNNLVSGIILAFERPVRVGDHVKVGEHLGVMRQIGVRASVIATYDGAEVIVPNGELLSRDVINYTLSDSLRRMEVNVGAAYGAEPERVIALLQEVAASHPLVLAVPAPVALFRGFGDSALNFTLFCFSDDIERRLRTLSELHVEVHAAFRRAGIEIPYPQRDLHLKSVGDAARAALGRS